MTQQAAGYEDCDFALASGRLRVRRWGAADAPAVVCVPGLSANLSGFDRLAERLAGETLQLVAIDLRGRGRSEVTGAGTYGWRNHARDVLGIADAVGASSFAIIGQSSGAAIHALWNAITIPALVLRARQEIMPGFGFILPAAEAERFAAAVPSARVVEIDANHYTITTHEDSIAAIGAFLRTS